MGSVMGTSCGGCWRAWECGGNQVWRWVGIGNVMGTQSHVWLVQQWEHDGYTESQVLESIGNAMEPWVSSVREHWERIGNQESQLLESTGNVRESEWERVRVRYPASWFPSKDCARLLASSCVLLWGRRKDRPSGARPKKEEFSNLGDRNSGGLHFPRSEFRLPRALRS